ncbi:MAG: ATP-binding protein [Gemmatimonadetes bacterium]|nr:ATP-binding protein [Gemmatimonadota bacterium]
MTKFKAEDAQSAVEYRDRSYKEPGGPPPSTKLTVLTDFWGEHFPGRSIDFSSYRPTAVSKLADGGAAAYPVSRMSDGERVALYLAATILDAPAGLLIVDEPEVHLHPVLARRLWDAFEKMRPDVRFVYITHDIPFALSRKQPQFIIVKPGAAPEILGPRTALPDGILESILGAASFSVVAEKIVFCEGSRGGDRDEALYRAWFSDEATAVIPVGSSHRVRQCVDVFNSGDPVRGGLAIGIIDRDYWPDDYFGTLPAQVHVLNVHEVESLFCLPGVFSAVASYIHVDPNVISQKYGTALQKARNSFQGVVLNKQILERVKRRIEVHSLRLLNSVGPNPDRGAMRTSLEVALRPESWGLDPSAIFQEEERALEAALDGAAEDFLRYLPGKSYLGHVAGEIGVTPERYVSLIVAGLTEEGAEGTPQRRLYSELEAALGPHLPPRQPQV